MAVGMHQQDLVSSILALCTCKSSLAGNVVDDACMQLVRSLTRSDFGDGSAVEASLDLLLSTWGVEHVSLSSASPSRLPLTCVSHMVHSIDD